MKRYITLLLMALGFVQAQTPDPTFQLYIAKTELSGEVKLVWTRPASLNGMVTYEVYRAMVSDSASFTLVKTTGENYCVDKVPTVVTSISNSYAYYVLGKSGNGTVKSNVQILPLPPLPPVGAFRLEGRIDSAKIKLYWQKPPVENVSYYIVHGGSAAIAAPMLPVIDSTTNLWSVTDVPPMIALYPPTPLAFYVVAHLTTGEVLVSTSLQLTLFPKSDNDQIHFVSVPPKSGQVNKPYEYTAKAVSNDSAAVIRYSGRATMGMLTMETGFSIDSVTGVVQWTPMMRGWYKVVIHAKSSKGDAERQEFAVSVAGGNGIIQGKVTDTLNVPIPFAVIEVFKTEQNLSFAYSAKTDENGNYQIHRVDPGKYKVKANAPSGKYQSQWYDGKREASLADVITVQDSPAVTIANFKLRGGVSTLPKVTVTGTVKDTLGLAINGANSRVVFVRAEFALNAGAGLTVAAENFRKYFEFNAHGDFRLEGNSEFVFKAPVDSLGNYTVKLSPGRYIAFARAHGYSTEFYFEKSDLLSADIFVASDEELPLQVAPNFTLAPLPPVALGEIKGAVLDSVNDIPVPARVIAFRDGWRFNDQHRIARVYVTDTDSTGAYTFSDLLPGNYVVMAVPLGNYAPAFYSSDDTTRVRWKRATKIAINGNSVDNIVIYVKQLGASANGYTSIYGSVSISGNGSGSLQGTSKAGAIVYAYREGAIAGYAMTDVNGNYSINGLAPGQYFVFVDKPGFNESSIVSVGATYDATTGSPLSGSANFTISSATSVTLDRTVQPEEFILEQNYPNPFNPTTTIRYALPATGNVTLKVYDILGKEVATLVNGYQQEGSYTVTFTGSNLSSGLYFYRLEAGSTTQVRKMVLMK